MYTGYFLMIFNIFAFVMTILNIFGFFSIEDDYFQKNDAYYSRIREKEYIMTVENRTDLSKDEKFILETQKEIEE